MGQFKDKIKGELSWSVLISYQKHELGWRNNTTSAKVVNKGHEKFHLSHCMFPVAIATNWLSLDDHV